MSVNQTNDLALNNEEKDALDEIKDQIKLVKHYTKFDELTRDGANFRDWKEETARAIYMITGINKYSNGPFPPLNNRLKREQNRAAVTVIEETINVNLQQIIRKHNTADMIMKALQTHFQKGGQTAQFAVFQKLISVRPNPSDDDVLGHTLKVVRICFKQFSRRVMLLL